MNHTELRLTDVLERVFGHRSFRPGQEEIIRRVLAGKNVLGVLPTGGGKSILYQLLSILLPHVTVIVSPLVSLMIDQVQRLKQEGKQFAVYVNSALDGNEMKEILQEIRNGRYKLLYISPEKLQQPYVRQILAARGVSLFAVDEAHCIAQWGHDFRTDYLRLPQIIAELGAPPVLAVTATATKHVQQEIADLLGIEPENRIVKSMNRANIALDVCSVDSETQKRERLLASLRELRGPGIVYCATRQAVETLVQECHLVGIDRVHGYHGGMSSLDRMLVQNQFLHGELDVIIATNAFGMGIDKANIRFVLHYHLPSSLEAYVQEVGRIGRDGNNGYACLYYLEEDVHIHTHMLKAEYPDAQQVTRLLSWLIKEKREQASLSELIELVDVTENQAELILFYAEQYGIVVEQQKTKTGFQFRLNRDVERQAAERIHKRLESAKVSKLRKLQQIVGWITEESCLRKGLLHYFDEQETGDSVQNCCSVCGIDRTAYEADRQTNGTTANSVWNVKDALRLLLPACEQRKEEQHE